MASYNELNALIDAYINRNGVQAITGQILNGVLKAMVEQLGRGYTIMGAATPTTDPGTPDSPESWFAATPGIYTNFGGLEVGVAELAFLSYSPTADAWIKDTLTKGIDEVEVTLDNNVGTPSATSSYSDGVLTFAFHNLKGDPGQPGEPGQPGQPGLPGQDGAAAGFGSVSASVDANVGTPSVEVSASGPDTAKVFSFSFHNLKGEQGPAGPQGEQGSQGQTGPAGSTGPQGKSAYQVAVDEGFEGDEEAWLASLVGPQGPQGIQGVQGPQGIQGATGADGSPGITPHIGANNHWFIGTTDTGILAEGTDGVTPHIGDNGHWYIGDTDTGVIAEGHDGVDGQDGVGFDDAATPAVTDGTFIITLSNGDKMTVDLNHVHPQYKPITISSSEPTSSDGSDGDIWIVI